MEHAFAERTRASEQLAAGHAPAIVHSVLATRGEPLPRAVGAKMRDQFRHDFSTVRVHTDERAAASAAAVLARAYSVGPHLVLGRGARVEDHTLLSHELTHVVQAGPLSSPVPSELQVAQPDDREERNASSAPRSLIPSGRPVLRRQLAPTTDRDRRDYVEQTIRFLQNSADYYGDAAVRVDQARASRVLDGWYRTVTAQEHIVGDLGGDPALIRNLRAAYTGAVATLLGRVATLTGLPLSDLYRLNRGRIPIWAWQEPHRMVPGITSPVPAGREADPITGAVDIPLRGVSVSILPDAPDRNLGTRAETRIDLQWAQGAFQWEDRGGRRVVTGFDPPPIPTATVQTFYGPDVGPASRSGYGRGTTAEDLAGASVDPRSSTVGFHEGQHGMDYVEFLRTNAPPVFGGRVGMTVRQFQAARQQWQAAWQAYIAQAKALSLARTDCVGLTVDEFEVRHAAGRRVRLVCPPQPRR